MTLYKNKYRIESTRIQNMDYGSEGMYYITICVKNHARYFGHIKDKKMILNQLGQIAHDEWLKTPALRPDMNLELGEFVVMPDHFHAVIIIGKNEFNTNKTRNYYCGFWHVFNGVEIFVNCIGRGNDGENSGGKINPGGVNRDAMHGVSINAEIIPIENNTDKNNGLQPISMHGVSIPADEIIPIENNTDENIDGKPISGIDAYIHYDAIIIPSPKNIFGPQSKNLGSIVRGFKSAVTTYARKNNIKFDWQALYYDHIVRDHKDFLRLSKYINDNPAKWKK